MKNKLYMYICQMSDKFAVWGFFSKGGGGGGFEPFHNNKLTVNSFSYCNSTLKLLSLVVNYFIIFLYLCKFQPPPPTTFLDPLMTFKNLYITYDLNSNQLMIWNKNAKHVHKLFNDKVSMHQLVDLNHLLNPSVYISVGWE